HHRPAEGEDAGERDVEISENPHRRGLDHMAAEPGEVAGTGAAGIDQSGGAAAPGDGASVDAERGAAPVDVGMQIDQPWADKKAGDVADLAGPIEPLADRGDLAAGEGDVALGIDALAGIDQMPAAQDEVMHGAACYDVRLSSNPCSGSRTFLS